MSNASDQLNCSVSRVKDRMKHIEYDPKEYFVTHMDLMMVNMFYTHGRKCSGTIYLQVFPGGKMYAGQTINFNRRMAQYRRSHGCNHHHGCAIKKYGGFYKVFVVYMKVPLYLMNPLEIDLIEHLDLTNPSKGYNKTSGGSCGYRASIDTRKRNSKAQMIAHARPGVKEKHLAAKTRPDVKKKMSDAQKLAQNRPEVKEKRSATLKITNARPEVKQRRSEASKTANSRPDVKKKISDAQKLAQNIPGVKEKRIKAAKLTNAKPEVKKKRRDSHLGDKNPMSKRVYQYSLDGTYIDSFASTGEAMRSLGKTSTACIPGCASGKTKSAFGFKWSYVSV